MRCVRFCARGVLVLSLVLSLGGSAYAFPRRAEDPTPRNPIVRAILRLIQIGFGDGVVIPIP
jgi:hypothetical protein